MLKKLVWPLAGFALLALGSAAEAAELKLLTAGAFEQVVRELIPAFEHRTGHRVAVDKGTAGALRGRIEAGEAFDVAVITPAAIDPLIKAGKFAAGSRTDVATVGVGVGVKEGAPKPDITTVGGFKQALLAAKGVAYIDPKSGGTSGMYIDKLIERLGIADQVRPKAKLKQSGGHAADFVVSGDADIVLQQMSEIVPVRGVVVVGPLPADIQNVTTYTAAVSTQSKSPDAAKELLALLSGSDAAALLRSKGMQSAP